MYSNTNNILRATFFIFCCSLFLTGCDKDENLSPRSFSTSIEDADISGFAVHWTESTDPENSIVKYRVYIAENLPEEELQLVADNISETQFADKNREYFFFYKFTGLKHNTSYKGKVVAFDQEGNETEIPFNGTTVEDTYMPEFAKVETLPFKNSADLTIIMRGHSDQLSELTADIYLNEVLVRESSEIRYESFPVEEYVFTEELIDLEEDTEYDVKIVVKALNNSVVNEFTFSTTGDTFEGDLTFKYQNEVDEFATQQYSRIKGNVIVYLPSGCHPMNADNECNFNITDLSILNTVVEIEGDFYIGAWMDSVTLAGDSVTGFINLESVTGNLIIHKTDLSNLFGKINNVGGDLSIDFSIGFTALDIFSNLGGVGGNIAITYNGDLADFCALETVITNGLSGSYDVFQNAYNPTQDDITNGNCSQ